LRYFIELAYKGSNFHGWQIQANAHTVQGEINRVTSTILRETVETTGSGRTDTGVHASQQYAHFDTDKPLDARTFINSMNALLPADIVIRKLYQVADDAHSRFDATQRSYEYRIRKQRDPFLQQLCYVYPYKLDIEKMNEAAALMLQYTDFESFSRVHTEVHTFNCQITRAEWEQTTHLLIFHISANRFLRGMVRAVTGTLLEVGKGKITVDNFRQIIEKKDRQQAGRALPPDGLFLTQVRYPDNLLLEI
jgi:tRNA pseudouridine38-40 synthase